MTCNGRHRGQPRRPLQPWLPFLLLLLSACGGGGGTDDSSAGPPPASTAGQDIACGQAGFREDALRLVNAARAQGANCGAEGVFGPAAPLAWNDTLAAAAFAHSLDMAEHDYFSHTAPDGSTPGDRVSAAGYRWQMVGENIAAGYPGVQAVVDGWMASPGHCANIMNPGLEQMGMACARNDASHYGLYYTLEEAAPR